MDSEKDQANVKPPKTYKEQVEILKSRNLHIEDSEYAEKYCKMSIIIDYLLMD